MFNRDVFHGKSVMKPEVVMMHKTIHGWEDRTRGFTLIELLRRRDDDELAETAGEEGPQTSD
jgi:hypothetical protein